MSDPSDTTAPRRRKRRRKAPSATPAAEPAVQVILEQALHPDPEVLDAEAAETGAPAVPAQTVKPSRRRGGRATPSAATAPAPPARKRRGRKEASPAPVPAAAVPVAETIAPIETPSPDAASAEVPAIDTVIAATDVAVEAGYVQAGPVPDVEPVAEADPPAPVAAWHDAAPTWEQASEVPVASSCDAEGSEPAPPPDDEVEPHHHDDATFASADAPPPHAPAAHAPHHAPVPHHWVYLAVGLFVAALGFGAWGVWTVFFAGGDGSGTSLAALRTRSDRLSQEVSTLRRSDQISRDANRDLERTLAERDEEIASLRADIAFYERFVGATGQRRGLSVHDLEMRRQDGDAWHFVATLTQNVNRGAVNSGRLTLSIEGTRRDRMERLSWTTLRKQPNAPGAEYSFKYFQQLEGEILLPADFKPLRVTVRLVPQGGAAVEQSFPWPETLHSVAGG
jgi:hypothetical protein